VAADGVTAAADPVDLTEAPPDGPASGVPAADGPAADLPPTDLPPADVPPADAPPAYPPPDAPPGPDWAPPADAALPPPGTPYPPPGTPYPPPGAIPPPAKQSHTARTVIIIVVAVIVVAIVAVVVYIITRPIVMNAEFCAKAAQVSSDLGDGSYSSDWVSVQGEFNWPAMAVDAESIAADFTALGEQSEDEVLDEAAQTIAGYFQTIQQAAAAQDVTLLSGLASQQTALAQAATTFDERTAELCSVS
jgi:hypothetical protein